MPKKYPPEFKREVVMVARRGDLTVPEVAVDVRVSEESVRRWMHQTDVAAGLKGSMGRVGSAGDNAAMESYWALLQRNVMDRQ